MPLSTAELTKLADENEIITVRNAIKTWVIHTDPILHIDFTWAPAGDPDGEDVQEVTAAALRNRDFRKFLAREMLVVEDAPEALAEALEAQRQAWQRRQQQVAAAGEMATSVADRTVARGVACIAPGLRGEVCGSYALVMGKTGKSDRPPLCGEHSHMSSQYVYTELDTVDSDGKPEVIWRRASLVRARG